MTQGPIRRLLEIEAKSPSSASAPEYLSATLVDHDDHRNVRLGRADCALPAPDAVLGDTGITVEAFLQDWIAGRSISDGLARLYGAELYRCIFQVHGSNLEARWTDALQAASGRGLHLILRLSNEDRRATWRGQRVDALPFELLHDGQRFLFRQRGWNVLRRLEELSARAYARDMRQPRPPRIQVAWANVPRGTPASPMQDELFTAHDDAVQFEANSGRVERLLPLPMATRKRLAGALRARRPDFLIWIGHGRDLGCGLVLHDEDEHGEPLARATEVTAGDFANDVRTGDVDVALLWSCHGAASSRPLEVGVAQALLHPDQGNVAAVLAAFSAIDARAAASMSKTIVAMLGEDARGDIVSALNEARMAQQERELHWARPVLFLRTPLDEPGPESREAGQPRFAMPPPGPHWRPALPPRTAYYFDGQQRLIGLQAAMQTHQAVVLEGLAGIGKTELALAAMHALKAADHDIAWIDVTGHRDLGLLTQTLGQLARPDPFETREALLAALQGLAITVAIDNAEDLLSDHRQEFLQLLDALRRLGPGFRLLLTSRHALTRSDTATTDWLHAFHVNHLHLDEARELFIASAGPRLVPEHRDADTLDPLLEDLGGIARAIVLMAAQLGDGMDVPTLHRRLQEDGPRVIAETKLAGVDLPDALDEDYDKRRLLSAIRLSLLSAMSQAPEAEHLFCALGIFPAGLDQGLLPHVDTPWLSHALSVLLQHHLVDIEDGTQRITMAAPVRSVASRKLQRDPSIQSHAISLAWKLESALVEKMSAYNARLGGAHRMNALQAILQEEPNIHETMRWCLSQPGNNASPGTASIAFDVLTQGGYHGLRIRESLPALKSLANKALGAWPDKIVSATTHLCMGQALAYINEFGAAKEELEKALLISRKTGYLLGEAHAHELMGSIQLREENLSEADSSYTHALDLFRLAADTLGEANAMRSISQLRLRSNDLDDARIMIEQALPLYRASESKLGEANASLVLGDIHFRKNRLLSAGECYRTSLRLYQEIADFLGEANALKSIGDLLVREKNPNEAFMAYKASLSLRKKHHHPLVEANALNALGDLYLTTDRLAAAEEHLRESLSIYTKIDDQPGKANSLQSTGVLLIKNKRPHEAFAILLEALEIQKSIREDTGAAATHAYLARAAMEANSPDHAIALSRRAQSIFSKVGDRYGQFLNYMELGNGLLHTSPEVGVSCLLQAESIAKEINTPTSDEISAFVMSIRHPDMDADDYASALDHFRAQGPAIIETMFMETDALIESGELDPYVLPPGVEDAGNAEPQLAAIQDAPSTYDVVLLDNGPKSKDITIIDRFAHPDAQETYHDE